LTSLLPESDVPVSEEIRRETSARTALLALDLNVETYGKNDGRSELSIHNLVRDWLLTGEPVRNEDGTEMPWTLMTRKKLLSANVVRTRDPYLLDLVSVNETHWSMYEFKRLADIASQVFTAEGVDDFGNYVHTTIKSKCWKTDKSYQLNRPEFKVKGDAFKDCDGLGSLLTCETLEQSYARLSHRRFKCSAYTAREVRDEMTGLSEAGVECSAALDDVDYLRTTNKQHEKLQQCLVDLREKVGWVIPAKKMVVSTIEIPVKPEMLIEGIFPAFMQKLPQSNAQSPTGENVHLYRAEYFLSDLTSVQYNAPESPIDLRVCFARVASEAGSRNLDKVKKTTPMHPFWGEFFDVAHSGNLVLEHAATGCDLKRSGKDNSLMILSTLCCETPGGGQQVCSRHPEYLDAVCVDALTKKLPEACVSLDGTVVNSERIGAMKSTPLCERQPDTGEPTPRAPADTGEPECRLQHGLINGQQGMPRTLGQIVLTFPGCVPGSGGR
jgi:hypothetical protein